MKKRYIVLTALLSSLLLCSCNNTKNVTDASTDSIAPTVETVGHSDTVNATTENNSDTALSNLDSEISESLYLDFTSGSSDLFEAANGWSNGNMFHCTWRTQNCTFLDERMKLTIDWDTAGANISMIWALMLLKLSTPMLLNGTRIKSYGLLIV